MNEEMKQQDVRKISTGISSVLADTYTLYLKTQNFHWNVTGPRFAQLHMMFEEHYTELAEAIDEIAERIRALGHRAPGTFKEFLELSSISEDSGNLEAEEMITKLFEGHQAISRKSREVLHMANELGDEVTVDLLTSRMKVHEKTAWMLKSLLA